MRIQIVSQYFYPEPFRITDIVKELTAQGHEVRVLTGLPNYPEGKVLEDYRKFQRRKEELFGAHIDRAWLMGRGQGGLRLLLNYVSFAVSAWFRALFIDRKADVVLIMQYSPISVCHAGYLYGRLTKTPVMLYCLDLWPESINTRMKIPQHSLMYKLLVKYCRMLYNRCDVLGITSRGFEGYFRDVLSMDRELEYIPQYAETLFEPTPLRSDNTFRVVFAGNVGKAQSVDTIIHAARVLKDDPRIRWDIVGSGSDLDHCKKLAKEFGLKDIVTFHGRRPLEDMPFFYDNADALVVTLGDNEIISMTLPGKVQTYMAAGRPVIGAVKGECARVIQEADCGLVCEPGDYNGLASCVQQMAGDRTAHQQYAANAWTYYSENFTKEMFFDRMIGRFEKMINEVRNVQE